MLRNRLTVILAFLGLATIGLLLMVPDSDESVVEQPTGSTVVDLPEPTTSATEAPASTTTTEPPTTTTGAAPTTTATPQTTPPTTTTTVAPADTLGCASFASREEAQAELDFDPTDPHNLDTNDDGRACTAYRYAGDTPESADMGEEPVSVRSGANWDALAQCESGGNWAHPPVSIGYSGGLMFHHKTWTAMGGGQYASHAYLATREQQIAIAEKVLAVQGRMAWPGCTKKGVW